MRSWACVLLLLSGLVACGGGSGGGSSGTPLPLRVTPVDFGLVMVGVPATITVEILNPTGGTATRIDAVRRSSPALSFGTDFPSLPAPLAPGERVRFSLTWAPAQAGASLETLEVSASERDPLVVQAAGAAFVPEEVTDLGFVAFEAGTRRTPELTVDLPSNAASLTIEAVGGSRTNPSGGPIFLESLVGPGNRVYVSPVDPHLGPYVFERNVPGEPLASAPLPRTPVDFAVFQIPNTDRADAQLVAGGGDYRFRLSNEGGTLTGLSVRVIVERRPLGSGGVGNVPLNVFLAAGLPVTAAGAPGDPRLQAVLSRADGILRQTGVGLGAVTYYKLANAAFDTIDPRNPDALFRQSALALETRVNVFFVPSILFGAAGLSGSIPGQKANGTPHSGMVILDDGLLTTSDIGIVVAHEIGHYLGLGHTDEQSNPALPWVHDIIDDTCPGSGCVGDPLLYLMDAFPPQAPMPLITPGQAHVLRAHPLVEPAPPGFAALTRLQASFATGPTPGRILRCATCSPPTDPD